MRRPAEHRLLGERRLRRISARGSRLRGTAARQRVLRGYRADPVRRRHRLQGAQGDGHQARRLGGDLRHRRAGARRGPVRRSRWAARSSPSTSTMPSSTSRAGSAPRWPSMRATGPRRVHQEGNRRGARRARDRRLAEGVPAGARHGPARRDRLARGPSPGDFPLSIFDMVLNGITVRGSIVGTRLDLQEALSSPARAGEGDRHDRTAGKHQPRLRAHARGDIEGRVVIDMRQ